MKNYVIILLLISTFKGFAQDPFFQKSNKKLEDRAAKITNEYNRELALSGDQILLFQQKVEEFLIRRNKIEKQYKGKEKLDLLLALQLQETAEMHNILTRLQMDVYKRVKPQIQPLEVVDVVKKE